MPPQDSSNEFRLKSGATILNYIYRFSATEKAVFGMLVLIAAITAILMASRVNSLFMTEIPAYGGTLTEGAVGLPHTINPVLAATDVDRDLSALVYSGLMKYQNGDMVPDLAKSYDVSDDGLTYTFTLKDNLHFQDGSLLTTDDIAYTIQKIEDPALKSPRRGDWQNIQVKVVSPTVISFILRQPYSPFLSTTNIGILPKHIWSTLSDDQFALSEYNLEPIGSGPYKESSIARTTGGIPSSYSLSTWKEYYGDQSHISTVTFKFYADLEKALSALDSGDIDSLSSISPADAEKLASDRAQAYTIASAPLPRIFGVFFNQSQAPVLADKNVRMALNMVVDRGAIVNDALNGYGTPIMGPLPEGIIADASMTPPVGTISSLLPGGSLLKTAAVKNSVSQTAVSSSTLIRAAQNLLEKNGWQKDPDSGIYELSKKGSKTVQTLSFDIYTADTPDLKETAEIVKNEWNALGAQVTVKVFEPADLYQEVIRTRKFDALLFGESIGKDRDLYAFWHSSQRVAPGLNVVGYANSKVDKILEDLRSTTDDSAKQAKYAQFAQLVNADIPAVFLYSPDFIYAIPKNLHNVDLSSVTVPSDRFNSIGNWYDTTEKVWKIFARNN